MKNITRIWIGIAYGLECKLDAAGSSSRKAYLPSFVSRDVVQATVVEIVRTVLRSTDIQDHWIRATTTRFLENTEVEFGELAKEVPDYFSRVKGDFHGVFQFDYLELAPHANRAARECWYEHIDVFQDNIRALISGREHGLFYVERT